MLEKKEKKIEVVECHCGMFCLNFYAVCSCNNFFLCHDHVFSFCSHGSEKKKCFGFDISFLIDKLNNDHFSDHSDQSQDHSDQSMDNGDDSVNEGNENFNKKRKFFPSKNDLEEKKEKLSVLDQVLLRLSKENVVTVDGSTLRSLNSALVSLDEDRSSSLLSISFKKYFSLVRNSGCFFDGDLNYSYTKPEAGSPTYKRRVIIF